MQSAIFGINYKYGFYILILPFLFLLSVKDVFSQVSNVSVDKHYEQARLMAFEEGDYDKARHYAYMALERSPDYHGIRIFVANLYSWEGNYERARKELNQVFQNNPDNRQALLAMIDVEYRSGNSKDALKWSGNSLRLYPLDEEFMLKQASVFYGIENYSDAEEVYRTILSNNSSSIEARDGLQSTRLKRMKYGATISYRHDRFSELFDPWNFWEFQLSRQTGYGSITGRIQHANRFATNGVQFNIDAYPSLLEGLYAYINGGYSNSFIYPRYRFGFSLYKSLPAAMELEAGIRYLEFSASQTVIYTASLTKYWGSYLFTGRTYIVPYSDGSSQSVSLLVRRYFGDAQTYIGISGGVGSAPADIQFAEDIQRLDSWSFSTHVQYPISTRIILGGNAGFDSEEYINFTRNRFSTKIYLSYKF